MPRLSEHERSSPIGMLKAGVCVSDVALIGQLHSASEIVTRQLGQLKIDEGLNSQEWRPALRAKLRRLCIDQNRSGWVLSVPDE